MFGKTVTINIERVKTKQEAIRRVKYYRAAAKQHKSGYYFIIEPTTSKYSLRGIKWQIRTYIKRY